MGDQGRLDSERASRGVVQHPRGPFVGVTDEVQAALPQVMAVVALFETSEIVMVAVACNGDGQQVAAAAQLTINQAGEKSAQAVEVSSIEGSINRVTIMEDVAGRIAKGPGVARRRPHRGLV